MYGEHRWKIGPWYLESLALALALWLKSLALALESESLALALALRPKSLLTSLVTSSYCYLHFHPVDIIWAVMIVWKTRWKIIRTVLCVTVIHNHKRTHTHTYEQFLQVS